MKSDANKEVITSEELDLLKEGHKKIWDNRKSVPVSRNGNRWLNIPGVGRVVQIPRPVSGTFAGEVWKKSYVGIGRRIVGIMLTTIDGDIEFKDFKNLVR